MVKEKQPKVYIDKYKQKYGSANVPDTKNKPIIKESKVVYVSLCFPHILKSTGVSLSLHVHFSLEQDIPIALYIFHLSFSYTSHIHLSETFARIEPV